MRHALVALLLTIVCPSASATEATPFFPMDEASLRTRFTIVPRCTVFVETFDGAKKKSFMSFWCEGKEKATFEDWNDDGIVDRQLILSGNLHEKRHDRNFDGKADFIETSQLGTLTQITEERRDDDFNGSFEAKESREEGLRPKTNLCSGPQKDTMGKILGGPNGWIGQFVDCYEAKYNTWVDDKCPSFVRNYLKEGLDTGLQCLRNRRTPQASSFRSRLLALFAESGRPVKFSCPGKLSETAIGEAALDSRNFPAIRIARNQLYNEGSSTFRNVIFHEYLHLALRSPHPHQSAPPKLNSIDHVIMCEACCGGVNFNGYLNSETNGGYFSQKTKKRISELTCQFCDGTNRNIGQYQAFMGQFSSSPDTAPFRRFVNSGSQGPVLAELNQELAKSKAVWERLQQNKQRGCQLLEQYYPGILPGLRALRSKSSLIAMNHFRNLEASPDFPDFLTEAGLRCLNQRFIR